MIDSHCHIDIYPDPLKEAIAVDKRRDVVVGVTNLPSHYQMGLPHLKGIRRVRLALGLHPLMAAEHSDEMELFDSLVDSANYIGEVGLDFSPEGYRTKELQIESFAHVLKMISGRQRFVTIHSRRAEGTVLTMLQAAGIQHAVFHWFSGSKRDLLSIVESGHLFSVNPAMVASENGRKLIALMPRDRVLTETDGPHVQKGGRPLRPADVQMVLEHLAELWSWTTEGVEKQIQDNFERALPSKGARL